MACAATAFHVGSILTLHVWWISYHSWVCHDAGEAWPQPPSPLISSRANHTLSMATFFFISHVFGQSRLLRVLTYKDLLPNHFQSILALWPLLRRI